MKRLSHSLILAILTVFCIACGPFMPSSKSKRSAGSHEATFHLIRATNSTTAGVTTQSTIPLRMYEGAIANVTTMNLTFNKLLFELQTSLTPDELRSFNPRLEVQFGNMTRVTEVQVSDLQSHEAQLLNLSARLTPYDGDIRNEPRPESLEDLQRFGGAIRILTVKLRLTSKPEADTTFKVFFTSAETAPQIPRGVRYDEEQHKPILWTLNRPGFDVTIVD